MNCYICEKELLDGYDKDGVSLGNFYEYRGIFACEEHFDEAIEKRDYQRNELIKREDARHKFKNGLDIYSDSAIAKHNRKIFKENLDALNKESVQMREYEGRA